MPKIRETIFKEYSLPLLPEYPEWLVVTSNKLHTYSMGSWCFFGNYIVRKDINTIQIRGRYDEHGLRLNNLNWTIIGESTDKNFDLCPYLMEELL